MTDTHTYTARDYVKKSLKSLAKSSGTSLLGNLSSEAQDLLNKIDQKTITEEQLNKFAKKLEDQVYQAITNTADLNQLSELNRVLDLAHNFTTASSLYDENETLEVEFNLEDSLNTIDSLLETKQQGPQAAMPIQDTGRGITWQSTAPLNALFSQSSAPRIIKTGVVIIDDDSYDWRDALRLDIYTPDQRFIVSVESALREMASTPMGEKLFNDLKGRADEVGRTDSRGILILTEARAAGAESQTARGRLGHKSYGLRYLGTDRQMHEMSLQRVLYHELHHMAYGSSEEDAVAATNKFMTKHYDEVPRADYDTTDRKGTPDWHYNENFLNDQEHAAVHSKVAYHGNPSTLGHPKTEANDEPSFEIPETQDSLKASFSYRKHGMIFEIGLKLEFTEGIDPDLYTEDLKQMWNDHHDYFDEEIDRVFNDYAEQFKQENGRSINLSDIRETMNSKGELYHKMMDVVDIVSNSYIQNALEHEVLKGKIDRILPNKKIYIHSDEPGTPTVTAAMPTHGTAGITI